MFINKNHCVLFVAERNLISKTNCINGRFQSCNHIERCEFKDVDSTSFLEMQSDKMITRVVHDMFKDICMYFSLRSIVKLCKALPKYYKLIVYYGLIHPYLSHRTKLRGAGVFVEINLKES